MVPILLLQKHKTAGGAVCYKQSDPRAIPLQALAGTVVVPAGTVVVVVVVGAVVVTVVAPVAGVLGLVWVTVVLAGTTGLVLAVDLGVVLPDEDG